MLSVMSSMMNLPQTSYICTHKQSIVNACELIKKIVNFRNEYADIYGDVIGKMEEFQKSVVDNAL